MIDRTLEGAGGGGGSTRTDDNLFSDDVIEIVLGISEGPIKGIVGDLDADRGRNIFIGDTPLLDAAGATNFSDFSVAHYRGTSVDTPIEFTLGGSTTNHAGSSSLPVSLATATPVTRSWTPPTDPTVKTLGKSGGKYARGGSLKFWPSKIPRSSTVIMCFVRESTFETLHFF